MLFGIHFSLNASSDESSERQLIYEEENEAGQQLNNSQPINPIPFDRSKSPFSFTKSRKNLFVFWVVEGKEVSEDEIKNNPKYAETSPRFSGATTFCYVNMGKFSTKREKNLKRVPNDRSKVSTDMDPNSAKLQDQP